MKKIIIFCLLLAFIATGCSLTKTKTSQDILAPEEAKAKAEEFINNNLMRQGTKATVKEVIDEGTFYKMVVDVGSNQDVESYLSKDGKKFFPQVMDIAEMEKQQQATEQKTEEKTEPASSGIKKDKPTVELFVMSHCPFGTQIEKGILPVLETLGDKIDFSLKFCSYAMHGKTELDEQLRQHCIQQEEPDKLQNYLKCFLEEGKAEGCLTKANINTSKLKTCVAATDKEHRVTEQYNDKSTWSGGRYPLFDVYKEDNTNYGVTGSPSLVINGEKISSGRDAASLLSVICAGFNSPPAECSNELSSTTPGPGFGYDSAGGNSSGGCGE